MDKSLVIDNGMILKGKLRTQSTPPSVEFNPDRIDLNVTSRDLMPERLRQEAANRRPRDPARRRTRSRSRDRKRKKDKSRSRRRRSRSRRSRSRDRRKSRSRSRSRSRKKKSRSRSRRLALELPKSGFSNEAPPAKV